MIKSLKDYYDIKKTCAITGHRRIGKDFDKENLKKVFIDLINKGYTYFLDGMAIGFDTIAFNVLVELKKDYDIKIIACIPCEHQDGKFSQNQKEDYKNLVKNADDMIILQREYDDYCMKRRNIFMVDNSSILVSYITSQKNSGTYFTTKYAVDKGKKVIYIK